MCEVLGVSPSAYYEWERGQESQQARATTSCACNGHAHKQGNSHLDNCRLCAMGLEDGVLLALGGSSDGVSG